MFKHILLAAVAALAISSGAQAVPAPVSGANAYSVTVITKNLFGTPFDAVKGGLTGGISATFTYTGPLDFNDPAAQNYTALGDKNSAFFSSGAITNYSGSGALFLPAAANFSTLSTFLNSSGSAANYLYGSLYSFDLGILTAGTVLTITHDDGISLYQGNTRIGTTTAGPTAAITETVRINNAADTVLYYARENGTPSILKVSVPEPVSISLLGTGLVALGLARRRNRAAA